MHTLEEIEARLSAIAEAVEKPDADIDALTEEADGLMAERQTMLEKEKRRKALRDKVSGGAGITVRSFGQEQQPAAEKREFGVDSAEYRVAYIKHLQRKELTEMEQRAFTVASGATPTVTLNRIMDVVRQSAWLLDRMTTIYTGAKVELYIEGTVNAAQDHTENQTINPDADTVTKITLTPSEITKLIQVSDAAQKMSIDAFEGWLVNQIGKAISRKVNEKILTAMMTAASSAGSTIDATTIQAMMGKVKGEDIAIVCNNNTLYTKLLPLEDKSKNRMVTFEGNNPRIYGRPVMLDDNMADDEVLCGDMSKAAAAIAEDVTVKMDFDIDTNSYKYLGVTVFDVKVAVASAFAKIEAAP